ncbi:MAG TPA: response regulator [Minicystis sp.]|nr:response regulator [Minicystis sp.]
MDPQLLAQAAARLADALPKGRAVSRATLVAALRAQGVADDDAPAIIMRALATTRLQRRQDGFLVTATVAAATPAAEHAEADPHGRAAIVHDPQHAVMVIDDDHDLRTTIQQELEERGYTVYGAANGMEAINLLRQIPPPRLILLDLMMPIMNGWDFLEAMRDDDRLAAIPVTVLTWLRHTRIPSSPVLTKPLDLGTLIDLVEQHAERGSN